MTARRIEIRIERLALTGFAPGIERGFDELLREELSRELADRATRGQDVAPPVGPVGRRILRPTDGGRAVAAQIARSIAERVP